VAKKWTVLTVTAAPEMEDSLASFLVDHGAPGVQSEQESDRVALTAYFAAAAPLDELRGYCARIVEFFPGEEEPEVRVGEITDDAWAESWKEHFPPLEIGERLFVHPPWVRDVPGGRLGIVVCPGMAFGTGHHASTRGVLVLLEEWMRDRGAARVLDVGTGSGILAIAAAKLGAVEVWATDVDADALRIAAENVRANAVADRVRLVASLDDVTGTFDVILINIVSSRLIALAPRLAGLVAAGGLVIGSGITADETDSVVAAWESYGLRPHLRRREDEWVTIGMRRPG
jgi:ribosomal protein L11 methyltransferase